jgi:hypothetical protein
MKRYLALLLLVIMVVSVVSATAATATAAAPKKLATPQLVAPRNNAIVPGGKPTTFKWKAVRGATNYQILWQVGTPYITQNQPHIAWGTNGFGGTRTTSLAQPFTIAGMYRWHITALSSNPSLNSDPSNWRYFTVQ